MLIGVNVTKYFGSLAAVNNVNFEIKRDEIVGLIGPNGAGKTTLFNLISGIYQPSSGEIKFLERDITGLKPHKICALGLARTHQIPKPFLNMTASQNVMVGALYGGKKNLSNARQESLRLLEFIGLEEKKEALTRHLTVHERKFLEIARALATSPEIVLLDEVVAGLNPTETTQAIALIRRIRDELGITVFWVEHVMRVVKEVAERVIVLHHGEKIAEGEFEKIVKEKNVIDAYLGEKYIF
jgi:branched-chain amino acid transport system ATP-binding protein